MSVSCVTVMSVSCVIHRAVHFKGYNVKVNVIMKGQSSITKVQNLLF